MNNGIEKDFERLQDDYWEWCLREYPELSTWTGDNRYNDRFTDLSWPAIEGRHADERRMLEEILKFNPSAFSGQNRLSHALLVWTLDLAVKSQRFPPVMLLTQIYGPHLDFPQLVSLTPFRTLDDYQKYLARLKAYPAYLDQVISLLRHGIETGWVLPAEAIHGVPDQIQGQLVDDLAQSPFYQPLNNFPDWIPEEERTTLQSDIKSLISGAIFPALAGFCDFVVNEYLPSGKRPVAATELPDGEAYYAHCIYEHITTDLSAGEIHNIGLNEVRRINEEMTAVIRQTGFEGSLDEFAAFLRAEPRFYFSDEKDIIMSYRDIAKRADAELPGLFAVLPRNPYGVRAFPDYEAPSQATAMYYPGASDGSRAGYFMVNTYRLDMRPKFEMEALVLHEAVPGHHLQISRGQELDHLPYFRRNATFTAYIEGWALYAESLGDKMGFYTDPYAKFGKLMYEMWRACRLVVDTGLHNFGWTRQKAIDYMREKTAKTEQDIAIEVDRYIVMPGQALAYKVGELCIKRLRDKAQNELGPLFDIRTFHNALLDNGAMPLTILEQQIDAWIEEKKV
ncbi:MAG: DUF885 domain-containing protein [Syntrophorhabdaceae bacterium]